MASNALLKLSSTINGISMCTYSFAEAQFSVIFVTTCLLMPQFSKEHSISKTQPCTFARDPPKASFRPSLKLEEISATDIR